MELSLDVTCGTKSLLIIPQSTCQYGCAPVDKARSIKTWMGEASVDELHWPLQSPGLHPIEPLWNELEQRLCVRPHKSASIRMVKNSYRQTPIPWG